MSHLLCPTSRQPVQFCESAACFLSFFILEGEGVACIHNRATMWGEGVFVCMTALLH